MSSKHSLNHCFKLRIQWTFCVHTLLLTGNQVIIYIPVAFSFTAITAKHSRLYTLAVSSFSQGKYEESEALLRTLTANYPQTGYMPAALFWLGNSLYASGELKQALEVENKLLKEFPKDARVPDALLTKAAAEVGLGQRTNASKTLQKIIKEHKDAPAAKVAQERLKSLNAKKKK